MLGVWGNPDWHVSTVDNHFGKFIWVYCPGHAGVMENDRADRLAGKATITFCLRLGGRSEVLRNFETLAACGHNAGPMPRASHPIDRLEDKGVAAELQRAGIKRSTTSDREGRTRDD